MRLTIRYGPLGSKHESRQFAAGGFRILSPPPTHHKLPFSLKLNYCPYRNRKGDRPRE